MERVSTVLPLFVLGIVLYEPDSRTGSKDRRSPFREMGDQGQDILTLFGMFLILTLLILAFSLDWID